MEPNFTFMTKLTLILAWLGTAAFAQTYTYKMVLSLNFLSEPNTSITIVGTKGYGSLAPGGIYEATPTGGVHFATSCCVSTASLATDVSGNLYGVDASPFHQKEGRVFVVSPQHKFREKNLYDFTGGDDGQIYPLDEAPVLLDQTGNVWGVAYGGGGNPCNNGDVTECGVVFELVNNQGVWSETVIHSFSGPPDGAGPDGGLALDPTSGTYYGTTKYGGDLICNCGTVFHLVPNGDGTWSETVIHTFVGTDGSQPHAGVIIDGQGNLYGTTWGGGDFGYGTVYEISGGQINVLHSFEGASGVPDGANPNAPLTFDLRGNLWGTTLNGGDRGEGTIFALMQNAGWQYSLFHSFGSLGPPRDGNYPYSGLAVDGNGNLWGNTYGGGGLNFGTFYEIVFSQQPQ